MTFKPGKSGNPSGRPKADPEIQALKSLTSEQFKEVSNLVLLGSSAAIKAIEADQDAPLFKRWLARMASNGFGRGDQQAMEFFLNRLLGKVPDKIEATGAILAAQVPADELKVRLEQIRAKRDG